MSKVMANAAKALSKGNFEKAKRLYESVLKTQPNNVDALHYLGISLEQLGKPKQGALKIEQSLKLSPTQVDAMSNLGNIYLKHREFSRAIAYFEQCLALNPGHFQALKNLGNAKFQLEDYEQALHHYQCVPEPHFSSLGLNDNVGACLNNMGERLLGHKCYPKALGYFKGAIETGLNNPMLWSNLAQCYHSMGQTLNAKDAFEQALDLEPLHAITKVRYSHCICLTRGFTVSIDYQMDSLSKAQTLDLRVLELIRCWISQMSMSQLLEATLVLAGSLSDVQRKDAHNALSFLDYINLLAQQELPSGYENYHFIGDSHSLIGANSKVDLLIGAKAWHLANDNENPYKNAFKRAVASVKTESLVLMFGEIDLRPNEGVFKQFLENNKPIEESTRELLSGYLAFVKDATQGFEGNVIIWGTPMPSEKILAMLDGAAHESYLKMVKDFNDILQIMSEEIGFQFCDVYALGSKRFYLDGIHLHPSALDELLN